MCLLSKVSTRYKLMGTALSVVSLSYNQKLMMQFIRHACCKVCAWKKQLELDSFALQTGRG